MANNRARQLAVVVRGWRAWTDWKASGGDEADRPRCPYSAMSFAPRLWRRGFDMAARGKPCPTMDTLFPNAGKYAEGEEE